METSVKLFSGTGSKYLAEKIATKFGEALGISHVESSPLTRSSYHARQSAEEAEQKSIDTAVSLTRKPQPAHK